MTAWKMPETRSRKERNAWYQNVFYITLCTRWPYRIRRVCWILWRVVFLLPPFRPPFPSRLFSSQMSSVVFRISNCVNLIDLHSTSHWQNLHPERLKPRQNARTAGPFDVMEILIQPWFLKIEYFWLYPKYRLARKRWWDTRWPEWNSSFSSRWRLTRRKDDPGQLGSKLIGRPRNRFWLTCSELC